LAAFEFDTWQISHRASDLMKVPSSVRAVFGLGKIAIMLIFFPGTAKLKKCHILTKPYPLFKS